MSKGKCPHRSVIYGRCDKRSEHDGPHRHKYSGVEWTAPKGGLTRRVATNWQVERILRDVHDRTGERPIPWLAEVCLADAEREVPACDYSVDRPDVLDSERESEVFRKALARALAAVSPDTRSAL